MDKTARANAPVFVVGCPRSGTTLLYHMLLSAGRFVRYRSETHVFDTLAARCGGMRTASDRRRAADIWLKSDAHRLTTLPSDDVRRLIETKCQNTGDFLRLIMEAMGRRQRMPRWADTTPKHLLHMTEIRSQIPNALFIHVLRDGRDVAASMGQQRWVRPWPPDRKRPALAAAAYWRWIVERGRSAGRRLGESYSEVRYEDLVTAPVETLRRLGRFIQQTLDWEMIQRVGIGSVSTPNTSFPDSKGGFIRRWQTELSVADANDVDSMLAPTLRSLGYTSEATGRAVGLAAREKSYTARFVVRNWLNCHTPLGRSMNLRFFQPGSMRVTEEKLRQAMPTDAA